MRRNSDVLTIRTSRGVAAAVRDAARRRQMTVNAFLHQRLVEEFGGDGQHEQEEPITSSQQA